MKLGSVGLSCCALGRIRFGFRRLVLVGRLVLVDAGSERSGWCEVGIDVLLGRIVQLDIPELSGVNRVCERAHRFVQGLPSRRPTPEHLMDVVEYLGVERLVDQGFQFRGRDGARPGRVPLRLLPALDIAECLVALRDFRHAVEVHVTGTVALVATDVERWSTVFEVRNDLTDRFARGVELGFEASQDGIGSHFWWGP